MEVGGRILLQNKSFAFKTPEVKRVINRGKKNTYHNSTNAHSRLPNLQLTRPVYWKLHGKNLSGRFFCVGDKRFTLSMEDLYFSSVPETEFCNENA